MKAKMKQYWDMVKAMWKRENTANWILVFVGGTLDYMGEMWFILNEHTWANYGLALTATIPGLAFMLLGVLPMVSEYYGKEDKGA